MPLLLTPMPPVTFIVAEFVKLTNVVLFVTGVLVSEVTFTSNAKVICEFKQKATTKIKEFILITYQQICRKMYKCIKIVINFSNYLFYPPHIF